MRHSAGPAGPPQRRCWACGHVWSPDEGVVPAAAAGVLEDAAVRAAIEKLDARVVRVRRRRS